MDAIKETKAIEAARRNELHAAHDGMNCVGEEGGKVLVRCTCGVLLAVVVVDAAAAEQPSAAVRRKGAREEGGE